MEMKKMLDEKALNEVVGGADFGSGSERRIVECYECGAFNVYSTGDIDPNGQHPVCACKSCGAKECYWNDGKVTHEY